jgi:HK97 family phage major capsid protein
MQFKEVLAEQTRELSASLVSAMKCETREEQVQQCADAFASFQCDIEATVGDKVDAAIASIDGKILAKRGDRAMTSKEKEFGEMLKASITGTDPKLTITDLDKAFPETIITTVLDDIKTDHELLDAIDFKNTSVVTKFIYAKDVKKLAAWGALKSAISEELSAAIDVINISFNKLSAFLTIPKDMLDVSPSWLVNLIMMILGEAIANGIENGGLNGTGKDMPIGMRKNLNGNVVDGVYPDKAKVTLNTLTPAEYCAVIALLAKKEDGSARKVTEVVLICNPVDYLTKILPSITLLTPAGVYATGIFPFPTKVIQSEYLAEGEAIIGIASKYFMGVGMPKSGRIEYSDHYQFLEDNRVYTCKLHGNGRPKDNNAFVLLDISNLQPLNLTIAIAGGSAPISPSGLSAGLGIGGITGIAIGTQTLDFNPGTTEYSVTTTNATNAVRVEASDGIDVAITVNGTAIANNASATWQNGENIVIVSDGFTSYTVTVTKQ